MPSLLQSIVSPVMVRQGDILMVPQGAPPPGQLSLAPSRIVQEGEHTHCLSEGQVYSDQASGKLYVFVEKACQLVHDEHKPVDLFPGWYEVRRQRSYRPTFPVGAPTSGISTNWAYVLD